MSDDRKDEGKFREAMRDIGFTPMGEAAAGIKEMFDSLRAAGCSRWDAACILAAMLMHDDDKPSPSGPEEPR